ncbi:hypothetical protein [Anatilimnocola floriformis]|uniref:hypothetical protein n=1 Tax=Anatilimnocola floriformis TaxID=2948575 RepID=UPI0020C493C6|nr:hypothetical protein [Anatilimnocola floriformis]
MQKMSQANPLFYAIALAVALAMGATSSNVHAQASSSGGSSGTFPFSTGGTGATATQAVELQFIRKSTETTVWLAFTADDKQEAACVLVFLHDAGRAAIPTIDYRIRADEGEDRLVTAKLDFLGSTLVVKREVPKSKKVGVDVAQWKGKDFNLADGRVLLIDLTADKPKLEQVIDTPLTITGKAGEVAESLPAALKKMKQDVKLKARSLSE